MFVLEDQLSIVRKISYAFRLLLVGDVSHLNLLLDRPIKVFLVQEVEEMGDQNRADDPRVIER